MPSSGWSAHCTCTISSAPGSCSVMRAADLIARARRVRLLSCDVDGVLTDGRIFLAEDGRELKAYSCLDGLGMKWLERSGVTVAWITGSKTPAVAQRARTLGIARVILGA